MSARERDPKLVALSDGFARLLENERRGINDEILGASDSNDSHSQRTLTRCIGEQVGRGAGRTPERGVATSNRTVRLAALLQVTLMIFLRAPEFRCRLDLRHDWTIKTAAFFHFFFRSGRCRFLLG